MVKMQWLCRVTLATLAQGGYCCSRSPCRLWSSGGRPPVPLGGRVLTDPDCVFQHNMWDHVQWSEEEMQEARRKTEENSSERIPQEQRAKYEKDASQFWDGFYETHQNKFFKDRRWLFQEFPELLPSRRRSDWPVDANADSNPAAEKEEEEGLCITRAATGQPDKEEVQPGKQEVLPSNRLRPGAGQSSDFPGELASFRILEVGCGAGNSVFPISKAISGRGAFLYCCDFSSRAVQLVKDHPDYDDSLCHAFVQDVCDVTDSFPFPPHSLDVILLVFVLSAIQPHRVQGVVNRLSSYLKPGGVVLFRDYGRYDLSQLRFKKGQCLSENFYSRHDGTCVYFFTKEEVHDLFSSAGLVEEQNLEDRRLKVNRAKKVVMRRVWMQSKFRKPLQPLQTC